jgi:predicted Zn-dependent protease
MLLAERKIGRDTDAAMQDYQALIDENENNFVALNNLAYLYLQRGNLEQAEQLADKAVDLQPNNPATKDTLAQVLVAQKMYDKALSLYSDVITSTMQNEEIYLNYVETLLLAGNTGVAQQRASERTYRDAKSLATIQRLNETYGIAVNIQ